MFYHDQTNSDDVGQAVEFFDEISTPNVRENKMIQSSTGPRSGISRIRKPWADEYPNESKRSYRIGRIGEAPAGFAG